MKDDLTPAGHESFRVEANEVGVPMTGPLGLVDNTEGKIIGRLVLIWPMGVAREQAETTLRDMYATAMAEVDRREAEHKRARLS